MSDNTAITVKSEYFLEPVVTLKDLQVRRQCMIDVVKNAMIRDSDYGVIPGTGRKPTLLLPGAQKLCAYFGLMPRFVLEEHIEDWTGEQHGGEPFFFYRYKCSLYRGDQLIAEGEGSCNSWEKKYRYRTTERVCPECGQPAIRKSTDASSPGFYCWAKLGGCGAKFGPNAPEIVNQETNRAINPDIYDLVNTLQKMAQKRAYIQATLYATNATEFYTQDIGELVIDAEWSEVSSPVEPEHLSDHPVVVPNNSAGQKATTDTARKSWNNDGRLVTLLRKKYNQGAREVLETLTALTAANKIDLSMPQDKVVEVYALHMADS